MNQKNRWITFSLDGKEISAITIKGLFEGEIEDTVKLLAYEKNVDPAILSLERDEEVKEC